MDESLRITYDKIGDFLFLDVCPPYAEQDSDEIGESVVARFNRKTGDIETVEILFFESWLKQEGEVRIPVNATLRPVNVAIPAEVAYPVAADTTLSIKYHHGSDTLTIGQRHPYLEQNDGEIDKGTSARLNPETGEIENLEIRAFKARLEKDGEVVLPINAALRPVPEAVASADGIL